MSIDLINVFFLHFVLITFNYHSNYCPIYISEKLWQKLFVYGVYTSAQIFHRVPLILWKYDTNWAVQRQSHNQSTLFTEIFVVHFYRSSTAVWRILIMLLIKHEFLVLNYCDKTLSSLGLCCLLWPWLIPLVDLCTNCFSSKNFFKGGGGV